MCNIVRSKNLRYGPGKLDFFAVYLIPIDLWYIIPFDVVDDVKILTLIPRSGYKFSQYMEAWHLLRGREKGARGPRRKPQAEPFSE